MSEDFENVTVLVLNWALFFAWMVVGSRLMNGHPFVAAFLTLPVSLIFVQYLAGVIHEAAHANFYRRSKALNDWLANYFACHVFMYSIDSYREGHFAHHQSVHFIQPKDEETASARAVSLSGLLKDMLTDLSTISALKLYLFRTRGTRKSKSSMLNILLEGALIVGVILLLGSPITAMIMLAAFGFSFVALYPLANRVRTWGTHADWRLEGAPGIGESDIYRNVHSPVYERVFFGNRMVMYHYEHHVLPHLTFRECEKLAAERRRARAGDDTVHAPTYLYCVRKVLEKLA